MRCVPFSSAANELPRVNLVELRLVREQHMPTHAVRFASEGELERVAAEVSRQFPLLREEAHFVKDEELRRRDKLSGTPLHLLS